VTALKPGEVSMQIIVPADLRRGVNVLAAKQDRTARQVVIDALTKYLRANGEPVDSSHPPG
jgi:hypothetical protein